MKNQAVHAEVNAAPIFSRPAAASDDTIYLSERRVEEMDPVEIKVPDEENIDPKKIEPVGNYGNNESPSNVDGALPGIDDSQAGDDEDTLHPLTPQMR